ncbi:response regulator transcription factor [Lentzea sp. JNUCC 0626]|uniref:response regulator transcription factor n=1 Tax=Lentzea sp. JNUCC 0626 TaxID=3367513 RepID=UPI00374A427C
MTDNPGNRQVEAIPEITVLLVQDDPLVSRAVANDLRQAGYRTQVSLSGLNAVHAISHRRPDFIVLDLTLPDIDGGELLRVIRKISTLPIVIACGPHDEPKIIQTLNAGADDYLVTPFSVAHLTARLRALLRRNRRITNSLPPLTIGQLNVDRALRQATLDGRPLDLNRKEFDVLVFLAERSDRVVSRREIVEAVWGHRHRAKDHSISVHISWLRRKLGESATRPRYLHTLRGVGIRLTELPADGTPAIGGTPTAPKIR